MFSKKTRKKVDALTPLIFSPPASHDGVEAYAASLEENPLESILQPIAREPQPPVREVQVEAVPEPVVEPADALAPENDGGIATEAAYAPLSARPVIPAPSPDTAPASLPIWARLAMPLAAAAGLAWAGALVAFCAGYQNRFGAFEYRPFPVIVFASLALLPVLFMVLAAYALRQTARMSVETRRARDMATELSLPAALAAGQVGGASEAVRVQIERAGDAAEAAERQLLSLRQALSDESERLVAVTEEAGRSAEALTASLARERTEMAALSAGLESRAAAVGEAIARQTRMVADASDLAAVQLQEAEAALAARATDLAAAAGEAGEAAELAGDALSKQADRLDMSADRIAAKLESAGGKLSTTLETTRLSLLDGHDQLSALAARLEADQTRVSERLEQQRRSIAAAAVDAEAGAIALAAASETGVASLRDLIAEAAEQVRILTEASQSEQAALDARARAALGLFTFAVAEERAAVEKHAHDAIAALSTFAAETRRMNAETVEAAERAATAQAEAARAQVEQLGEAAFAAGQKADQGFDARINAARKIIEASAALVEDAGQKSVERIEAGVTLAREALAELEALMGGVDERLASAPEQVKAHADKVRETVEASLELVTAAARKASAETQGVDAAFQERVKRNYEILSEALRTMGKVASAVEQSAMTHKVSDAAQAPAAVRTTLADAPLRMAAGNPAAGERGIRAPGLASSFIPPPVRAAVRADTDDIGLRPRLKLSAAPMPSGPDAPAPATDADIDAILLADPVKPAQVQEKARAPEPEPTLSAASSTRDGGWTWKDLLSSIDEPPIDDEVLAERLISEIEALGLDAAALLPLTRIDEIAAVMQSGDNDGVRAVVRSLAPGAVRRLSRRVLTDKVLRSHADRYVRRYEDLLHDSQRRDREGFMTAALLGSGPGRAFLLFDAAVGELH